MLLCLYGYTLLNQAFSQALSFNTIQCVVLMNFSSHHYYHSKLAVPDHQSSIVITIRMAEVTERSCCARALHVFTRLTFITVLFVSRFYG